MTAVSGATHPADGPRLYDRAAELSAVARLSARAAAGRGGVLFVTGNPGEGRTALLRRAAHDFPGAAYRVAAPHHRGPWSAVRALFAELALDPAAHGPFAGWHARIAAHAEEIREQSPSHPGMVLFSHAHMLHNRLGLSLLEELRTYAVLAHAFPLPANTPVPQHA